MKRSEYEQQKYQRHNPHLFTTLDQCVNADGSLTTFDGVTVKIREVLDKLQVYHSAKYTGTHPLWCMRPVVGQPEDQMCQMIEFHNAELDKVRGTFVRNYKHMQDRIRA